MAPGTPSPFGPDRSEAGRECDQKGEASRVEDRNPTQLDRWRRWLLTSVRGRGVPDREV